jgi:hypothetical protein
MQQLVREAELLQVVRIKPRTLRDLRERKVIPFIQAGDRTFLYDPEEVLKSLAQFKRESVQAPGKRKQKAKAAKAPVEEAK